MTLAIGAIVLLTASGTMGFEAKAIDCEKWNTCQLACDAGGPAKNICRVGCNKKNNVPDANPPRWCNEIKNSSKTSICKD